MIRFAQSRRLACGFVAVVSMVACGDDGTRGITADTQRSDAADTGSFDAADTQVAQGPPLANLYAVSPTDTPELTQVELAHLTDPDGAMVGAYARVQNCLPDLENGEVIPLELGTLTLNITPCTPASTARPGADGSYLHITPPATAADDDGTFAELMMYHHMQVIHDYYKDVHGLTERDHPLEAIVNIQAHIDLCDQWARLPNAAFIPEESLSQLPFGLDFGLTGDAIVFSGSSDKNFAFDASVIYHEYTHAMLGATRLSGAFFDRQGVNNLPGALNEAYADYFALTVIDDGSLLGNYTLNDLEGSVCGFPLGGGGAARNLDNDLVCPRDLTAEVHADSEIFSAALWEIREALGAEDADAIILAAVLTLTHDSGFAVAAEATLDAALELGGPDAEATVLKALTEHNVLACERVVPAEAVGARGLAISVPSASSLGVPNNPFGDSFPGYVQYAVEVPEGAAELTLTFDLSAGGGLFGGGGGEVAVDVALKAGGEPVAYVIPATGPATHDADAVFALDPESKALTLSGSCLTAGTWTVALHNRGDAVALGALSVQTSDTAEGAANFEDCGE